MLHVAMYIATINRGQNSHLNPVLRNFLKQTKKSFGKKCGYREIITSCRKLYFVKLWVGDAPKPKAKHLAEGDSSRFRALQWALGEWSTLSPNIPGPEQQLRPGSSTREQEQYPMHQVLLSLIYSFFKHLCRASPARDGNWEQKLELGFLMSERMCWLWAWCPFLSLHFPAAICLDNRIFLSTRQD